MANSLLITELELRTAVLDLLHSTYGDSAPVVEELGIENGASRIDLALVAETIAGYEIKSDFDSNARLYNQIHSYNRVFDYIYIVTSPVSAKSINGILPSWWGVLHGQRNTDGLVQLTELKKPSHNPGKDIYSLLTLLKRDELNGFAEDKQLPKKIIKGNKPALLDSLADSTTLDEASHYVTEKLRARFALSVA